MAKREKVVVELSPVDRALLRQIRDFLRDMNVSEPEETDAVKRLVESGPVANFISAPNVNGSRTHSSQAGLATFRTGGSL